MDFYLGITNALRNPKIKREPVIRKQIEILGPQTILLYVYGRSINQSPDYPSTPWSINQSITNPRYFLSVSVENSSQGSYKQAVGV